MKKIRKAVLFLLDTLSISTDEVAFYFVTEKKISELHLLFFDDPTPTDCITFPIDSFNSDASPHVLGEVFVCPKTAILYAKSHQINVEEELLRYVIHGILHLIGYEDATKEKRAIMKRKENTYLKKVLVMEKKED